MNRLKICFCFCLLAASCAPRGEEKEIIPAFYHWKTNFQINPKTHSDLQKIGIQKLYVKFFDVDWSEELSAPTPAATVQIRTDFLENYQIIPTVFITNRTFRNLSESGSAALAKNITQKLKSLFDKNDLNDIEEVQFDCDWSLQTKDKFFEFLKTCKTLLGKEVRLSATIRLHQIKFFEKTGVPPVERGMLMFYNMSDAADWSTQNSILDLTEAAKYLTGFKKYPLPTDVVLPAYAWGVLFRDGEMIKLLPGTYPVDCRSFSKIDSNRYQIPESNYFEGHYLYKNDRIRLEDVSPDSLLKAGKMLSPLMKNSTLTVGFYHLHEHSFKRYTHEDYSKILEEFN